MSAARDWRPWQPEDGDRRCQECGGSNGCWRTSHHLWTEVMGGDGGVLCPTCFIHRAEAQHIGTRGAWVLMPPHLTISQVRGEP